MVTLKTREELAARRTMRVGQAPLEGTWLETWTLGKPNPATQGLSPLHSLGLREAPFRPGLSCVEEEAPSPNTTLSKGEARSLRETVSKGTVSLHPSPPLERVHVKVEPIRTYL